MILKNSMRKYLRLILVGMAVAAMALAGTGCTAKAKKAYHLRRADKFYAATQYDQAEIEYINALRNAPLNSHAIGRLGLIYYNEGRVQHAAPYLLKATELDTNNLEYRLSLGYVSSVLGRSKDARDSANYVLDHQPLNIEAPLLLAEASSSPPEIATAQQKLATLDAAGSQAPIQVALGTLALKTHDLKAATAYFNRALTDDPNSSAAQAAMGTVLWNSGDLKQADEHFQKAAALAPPRSPRQIQYAQFKIATKDFAAATHILEGINQTAPDYLPAMSLLAEIGLKDKNFDDAGKWVDTMLARDPDNYEAMSLQSRLKLLEGKPDEAVPVLDRMVKLYPQSPHAHLGLAQAYLDLNDLDKAEFNLNRALDINSNYVEASFLLGEIQIKNHNPAPVVAAMKRIIARQPQLTQAQLMLADADRLQGNVEDALAIYQSLEKGLPQNPVIPFLEASAYRQLKQNDQAVAAYNRVLVLDPTNFPAFEGLVNVDLAGHQYATALQRIQNELQKRPNDNQLNIMLAQVYEFSGNTNQAEATLQHAIEAAPDNPQPYLLLASVYLDQKQYPKATDKLSALLAKDPKNLNALMLAATIHDQAGEYQEEAEELHKMLDVNPKISAALNNLAYVDSEHLGKLDEAFDLAQRAHDLLRNDPSTSDTLGWISFQKGSYTSALELLQDSARSLPREPSIQYHLGMANYVLGNTDAARDALQRALQLSSSFDHHEESQQVLNILAIDPQTADANAQSRLEKRVGDKPDDQIALAKLAAIYQRNGDADKATSTYEALLRANPQNLAGSLNLARLYAAKDPKKAYDFARAAYKQAPDNPDVLEITGNLAYQNGDYRLAYTLLQQATQVRSLPPQTQFVYAQANYSMGKIPEAQQLLASLPQSSLTAAQVAESQRLARLMALVYTPAQAISSSGAMSDILKSEPNYVPALMVMGVVDEQKGDAPAASSQYEKVLATFPDFIPAERQLTILYAHDTNKLAQGYAFGVKCREFYPNDPGLAKAMGLILYQQGDFSRAASQLRDAARTTPDAETLFYLGSAQYQLKNRTESKANLQRALDLKLSDAQADAARKMLAQLK